MMESTVTRKLYQEDVTLMQTSARVVSVSGNQVVLDATCFYPEGGGQVGDRGMLGTFRVADTQMRGGTLVTRPDLPVVSVNTEVVHYLESSPDGALLAGQRSSSSWTATGGSAARQVMARRILFSPL